MSRHPAWSRAESDYLEEMAGSLPFPVLLRRYQCRARREGWPPRTKQGVMMRLHRLRQIARVRQGQWLTTGGAGDLLGCDGWRITSWLRRRRIREILEPRRFGNAFYIHRDNWKRLAREYPKPLGGFPADRLFLLLEDRELADAVAAAHPCAIGDMRVRCVETGQIWPSAEAAGRELNVDGSTISLAIRKGRAVTSLGLTFVALRACSDC
ncbi:MAG: hypothetical protein ACO3FA_09805, partial [Vulcanococcus sp.]